MNTQRSATRRLERTRRSVLVASSLVILAASCGSDAVDTGATDDVEVAATAGAAESPDPSVAAEGEPTPDPAEDAPTDTEPPTTTAPAETGNIPANDALEGAIVIDPFAMPFADSVDTTAATSDADVLPSMCGSPETGLGDAGVWYSLTPEEDSRVLLSGFGSDYSWEVAVATGEPDAIEFLGCRPFTREIVFEGGVTHYILVYDNQLDGGGNGGQMNVTVEILEGAPPNDLIADATVVDPASLPFSETADVTGAGVAIEDIELGCPAPEIVATVFYSFTPDRDMRISVNAEGSDFPAGVSVGAGPGAGECRPGMMEYDVESGVSYLVWAFDGQEDGGGNGGTLDIRIDEVTE